MRYFGTPGGFGVNPSKLWPRATGKCGGLSTTTPTGAKTASGSGVVTRLTTVTWSTGWLSVEQQLLSCARCPHSDSIVAQQAICASVISAPVRQSADSAAANATISAHVIGHLPRVTALRMFCL